MSVFQKWIFGASPNEALFAKRRFICEDDSTREELEKIGAYFLYGYNNCLLNYHFAHVQSKLEAVDFPYRGFSYEGAAMGYTMLDAVGFKRNRFQNFLNKSAQKHIYMVHVGAGWAYAKLPGHVEKKIQSFDPLLKWLVIDGYGFCHTYFNTKKYVIDRTMPSLSDYGNHVFYQGLGRCLWFVEGTNPERIAKRISSFPREYASDLWSGTGLASAYAGGVERSILEQIKTHGQKYILNIGQGSAFAAAARIHAGNLVPHTDMACMVYSGITAQTASEITKDSRLAIAGIKNDEVPAYERWRKKICSSLSEIVNHYSVT